MRNLFFCPNTKISSQRTLSSIFQQLKKMSLRKQPTFRDATTGFPAKWRQRIECRNSVLMTCHYPNLGSASDWPCRVGNLIPPTRSLPDLGSDASSVWNFCARFSDLIWPGNQWWRRKMPAVSVSQANKICFIRFLSLFCFSTGLAHCKHTLLL